MKQIRDNLTYANVMATIAVFIALGGASYAAVNLPKNSVGTKQLKNGSVTQTKIASAAQLALKGAQGPQGEKGAKGDTGPKGDTGAPGSPLTVTRVTGTPVELGGTAGETATAFAVCPAGTTPISGSIGGFTTSAIGRSEAVGQSWEFSMRRLVTIANPNTITPSVFCLHN